MAQIFAFFSNLITRGLKSGENYLVVATSTGLKAGAQTIPALVDVAPLDSATFDSNNMNYTVAGLTSQQAIGKDYSYFCTGQNTWQRRATIGLKINWIVGTVPDATGAYTDAQLKALYPNAVDGNVAVGVKCYYVLMLSVWRAWEFGATVAGGATGLNLPIQISDVYNLQASLDSKANENELASYQGISQKGAINGYASLDATGKVPTSQLPATGTSSVTTDSITDAGTTGKALMKAATPVQAQSVLSLGTAATLNVGTATGNVMQVGAFGLGAMAQSTLTDFKANNVTGYYLAYGITSASPAATPNAPANSGTEKLFVNCVNDGINVNYTVVSVSGIIYIGIYTISGSTLTWNNPRVQTVVSSDNGTAIANTAWVWAWAGVRGIGTVLAPPLSSFNNHTTAGFFSATNTTPSCPSDVGSDTYLEACVRTHTINSVQTTIFDLIGYPSYKRWTGVKNGSNPVVWMGVPSTANPFPVSATPTIVEGAGIGTGGKATISGSNTAGTITITAGTGGTTLATVCTITLTVSATTKLIPIITAAENNAANLQANATGSLIAVGQGPNTWVIKSNMSAALSSMTCTFNYLVGGF